MELSRREYLVLLATAPLAGAKNAAPRIACQCYVFEQAYGQKQQKTLDHADEIFATLHEAGYRAVELTSSFFPVGQTEGTLALLDKHALALPIAYIGGPMHNELAPKTVETALAYADRLKGHKGLEAISFNCDPKPGHAAKSDAELETEAKALEQLGSELAQQKLRLLVHQHAPEMADHAREWRYFVKNTTAKNVGICMDTHWSLRGGEDPLQILREAGKRVGDVHLRNSKDGVWLEELTDGDLDYRAVAAQLKKIGYRGWLTVELAWDPKTQITRPLGENLRRSREYAERVFGVK
jgi:inosose dehydratase